MVNAQSPAAARSCSRKTRSNGGEITVSPVPGPQSKSCCLGLSCQRHWWRVKADPPPPADLDLPVYLSILPSLQRSVHPPLFPASLLPPRLVKRSNSSIRLQFSLSFFFFWPLTFVGFNLDLIIDIFSDLLLNSILVIFLVNLPSFAQVFSIFWSFFHWP